MASSQPSAAERPIASQTRPNLLPYLALVSGILALSLSGLFVHWAEAPGMVTSFYRMLTAAVALLPVVLTRQRRSGNPGRLAPHAKRALLLPALGGLFVALDHGFWSTSIHSTQVGTATLLNNTAPLWVAIFAFFLWRERLSTRFWLGLALTLVGISVVFGNDLLHRPHFGGGDFLALFSSLFYAAYFLVTQRARQDHHTLTYTWMVTAGGAIFLLIGNLALGNRLTGYSTATYLAFLGAGIISQIVGYFSVAYALGHLPAAVVSPSMIAQPVLTMLLAIPLAGELPLPGQWLGSAAVLAGIYLVNISHRKSS